MSDTLRARTRSIRLDLVIVTTAGLVVYLAHGFQESLRRDPATFVYGGTQFARGVPPYRDIFNSVGPIGDMVAGVGVRVGWLLHVDALTSARVVFLLLSAACVAGTYILAREVSGSRATAILAAAVFLTFTHFIELSTDGPCEKTVMVLCVQLGVVCLLRRRWYVAGLLTALATLTWQPALVAMVPAAVVALVPEGSAARRVRAALRFVAGGATPVALLAVYFAAEGTLRLAYWGFVRVNVGYTDQPDIRDSWPALQLVYGWSLAGVVAGVALAILMAAAAARPGTSGADAERSHRVRVLGVLALAATLWSCYAINGGADLFVLLPVAATGLAATLGRLVEKRSAGTVRAVVGGLAAVAVVLAGVSSVATRGQELGAERADVAAVMGALPPHARVLSVSAPEVLVLAHRTNPYSWQLSNNAMSALFDDYLPGGLRGYAARIRHLHPALIAVGFSTADDWLRPLLRRHYRRIGSGTYWNWYAARSLGAHRLQALSRASADARS